MHNLFLSLPQGLPFQPILFMYLGPETIMPLASVLAAVIGVLLIAWRYVLAFFKKVFKIGGVETDEESSPDLEDTGEAVSDTDDEAHG